MAEVRLAWAVSGSGTTLQAVIKAGTQGLLNSRVVLVVADRDSPTEAICHKECIRFRSIIPSAQVPWKTLQHQLKLELSESQVDWFFLTFNRLLDASVINAVHGKVVNLHMSLLPAFPGFGATAKALAASVRTAGVTVHLVNEGIDTGPILAQVECPVLDNDSQATLGRRQFEAGVPVVLQVIRSIERGDLDLDIMSCPIWRSPLQTIGRSHRLVVDADLMNFSRQFCRAVPVPERYSSGRMNLVTSDPVQKSGSTTETKPSKSP